MESASITPLLMPQPDSQIEYENWLELSAHGLTFAYGDEEPSYKLHLVREPNPDYEIFNDAFGRANGIRA